MELIYTAYRVKTDEWDDKACSKEIFADNSPNKFFLLYHTEEKLFNPWNLTHLKSKKNKLTKLHEWRWVPVSEYTFRLYQHFLYTRNSWFQYLAEQNEIFKEEEEHVE